MKAKSISIKYFIEVFHWSCCIRVLSRLNPPRRWRTSVLVLSLPGFVPRRRKNIIYVVRGLKRGEARSLNALFSLFLLGHCVEFYQANRKTSVLYTPKQIENLDQSTRTENCGVTFYKKSNLFGSHFAWYYSYPQYFTKRYFVLLLTKVRFPIAKKRITCHESKQSDSLRREKLTNTVIKSCTWKRWFVYMPVAPSLRHRRN